MAAMSFWKSLASFNAGARVKTWKLVFWILLPHSNHYTTLSLMQEETSIPLQMATSQFRNTSTVAGKRFIMVEFNLETFHKTVSNTHSTVFVDKTASLKPLNVQIVSIFMQN